MVGDVSCVFEILCYDFITLVGDFFLVDIIKPGIMDHVGQSLLFCYRFSVKKRHVSTV
jgi:hypothetical protein